ncbi:MAG: hypothetical protein ACYTEW_27135 [Planctomycetota bacterium]
MKKYLIVSIVVFFIVISTVQSQSQFIWFARSSVRVEIEALKAENIQLRADMDTLIAKMEAIRQATAWIMAYELDRQQTLLNANFPIGNIMSDVAGNTILWSDALQAAQATKTAAVQTLYDGVKDP